MAKLRNDAGGSLPGESRSFGGSILPAPATAPNPSGGVLSGVTGAASSAFSSLRASLPGGSNGYTPLANDESGNTANTPSSGFFGGWLGNSATPAPEPEWIQLTYMQKLVGFAVCAGTGVLCFFISIMKLTMVSPTGFAAAFSMGSLLILLSIAILRGPRAHIKQMISSRQRGVMSLLYIGALFGTLYFSVVKGEFLGAVVFAGLQFITLVWYLKTYLPSNPTSLLSSGTSFLPI
ncbi:SFT2-domain-containing protein [Ramicandelaber brevisporus]|nr:SFT2-domain-containing protein [Ramicandelaber brevisporus]KAI8872747.1 SFT2-domain-containing protein [Ramicandelaber brevisporus]